VTLSQQLSAVRTAFCGAGNECSAEGKEAPSDDLDGLQALLSALPLDWARRGLFAQPAEMRIPAGRSVTLSFEAVPGDRSVATGRLRLLSGAALSLTSKTSMPVTGAPGTQICDVTLDLRPIGTPPRPEPETRLALAAALTTTLTLGCGAGPQDCLVLLDNQSANLARNGECKGEE
jgi:hypothetical protein